MIGFEDFETDLLFEQLSLEEEQTILEANISSEDLGIPFKSKKQRYVMITGAEKVSHNGRMKVSKHGIRISRTTSYNDYISIHRDDSNTITHEGDLTKIGMSNAEYKYYVNLFLRNENLVNLAQDNRYDNYVDQAFISDELARNNGNTVNRHKNGDADVYNSAGELLYRKNIKGERIK